MFRVPCSISTLWLPVTSSSLCSSCCLRHKSFITIRHSVARCKREKVMDSIHPRRIGWRDCGRLFQGKPPPPPPWGWFGEGVFIWAVWLNEKRAHTRFPVQFHTPTSYLIHCSWCWIEVYLISLFNEVNRSSRRSAISTEWNAPLSSTEADSMLHTWNWICLFSENKKHRQEIRKTE